MNARVLLPRLGGAIVLATLAGALLATSSLLVLVPAGIAWPWLVLGSLVLFLPGVFARGSPLPATLATLVPVLAVAAYGESRLDWMRLLKDFGLTEPGSPSLLRLGLGLGAFATAWAVHVQDHALRLRQRAAKRGIDAREARAAHRLALVVGARRGGLALGATLALALVATVAAFVPLPELLGGRTALLAPLLAAALVGVAAYLLTRRT